jgi:hypothetical protein
MDILEDTHLSTNVFYDEIILAYILNKNYTDLVELWNENFYNTDFQTEIVKQIAMN